MQGPELACPHCYRIRSRKIEKCSIIGRPVQAHCYIRDVSHILRHPQRRSPNLFRNIQSGKIAHYASPMLRATGQERPDHGTLEFQSGRNPSDFSRRLSHNFPSSPLNLLGAQVLVQGAAWRGPGQSARDHPAGLCRDGCDDPQWCLVVTSTRCGAIISRIQILSCRICPYFAS